MPGALIVGNSEDRKQENEDSTSQYHPLASQNQTEYIDVKTHVIDQA
jgi:hypothetical protein